MEFFQLIEGLEYNEEFDEKNCFAMKNINGFHLGNNKVDIQNGYTEIKTIQ